MPFKKLRQWLKGQFACSKCGQTYYINSFGSGKCICPNCFTGEQQFLLYDNTYWLNRMLHRVIQVKTNDERDSDPLLSLIQDSPIEIQH